MLPTFRSTNLKTATWLLWQRSTRVSIARKLQWRRVELQLKTPTNTGCSGDGQTLSCPLGANTSRPWHSVRENRRCADWSTNYCQSTGQSGGRTIYGVTTSLHWRTLVRLGVRSHRLQRGGGRRVLANLEALFSRRNSTQTRAIRLKDRKE